MMQPKQKRYQAAIAKEWKLLERQEEALRRAAQKESMPKWKSALTDKVPKAVFDNLQKAFGKAFWVVFEKGTGIIEKTYDRASIQEDCQVREFAFQVKASRKTLKKARKDAGAGNLRNLAITSAEGIGLGILGIGLPDIVMFVGVLLKGVYETALQYGYPYDSDEERYFILKLMETAVSRGDAWEAGNDEVDRLIEGNCKGKREDFGDVSNAGEETGAGTVAEDSLALGAEAASGADINRNVDSKAEWPEKVRAQISRTADAFAVDMVLLKFIQGLPVVGIVGGAGNPLYYSKVIKYAELKYRKRYLMRLQNRIGE